MKFLPPRWYEMAMVLVGLLLIALSLTALPGCAVVPSRPDTAPLDERVKDAVAAKVEAEHKADEAIKTSGDARGAAGVAKAEARAARALADEKDGEVRRLEVLATELQNAEIAKRIVIASWWLCGVGVIVAAVGAFLFLRFQSKTAGVAALCGLGSVGLGVIGLWLAPHWLLVAWIFGASLLVAAVGGLVWLLLHRDKSAAFAVSELKRYAAEVPADIKAELDRTSIEKQSAAVKAHIDYWLNLAKVPPT